MRRNCGLIVRPCSSSSLPAPSSTSVRMLKGATTLSLPSVILIRMSTPEGWSAVDGALQREFRFPDFAQALAFVNRVGELAEAENHHPDVELGWGRVVLRWRTHSADAITDRDREMARRSAELES